PSREAWLAALDHGCKPRSFARLKTSLAAERGEGPASPAEGEVFHPFRLTPFEQVQVVLLGDEPSREADSDGLAFSVRPGKKPAPELKRIYQELRHDLGCRIPETGCLAPWAKQGVLLLNRVLTARSGMPGAHARKGWETFTDATLRALSGR